jgi:hypothetical protein
LVDKVGSLGPFRIGRDDLIDLAKRLDEKLSQPPDEKLRNLEELTPSRRRASYRFRVTIGRYSEDCYDMKQLESFLGDIGLPNVVDDFSIAVSSAYGASNPSVNLTCNRFQARYSIRHAHNIDEANTLESVVVGFHKRHKSSRFFQPVVGFFLKWGLASAVFVDLSCLLFCPLNGSFCWLWSQYRSSQILFLGLSLTTIAYVEWSSRTSDTPLYSFSYALLYVDKQPRNPALGVLVAAVIVDIIAAVVVRIIFQ